MKLFVTGLLSSLLACAPAMAATITNADNAPVVVQITDGNGRIDLSLDPGASEDVCPAGCFVTLPNGDRVGLDGGENVEIKDGSAHVN